VEIAVEGNASAIDTIVVMKLDSPAAEIKTIATPVTPKTAAKAGGGF
jgi:hypothetical protein